MNDCTAVSGLAVFYVKLAELRIKSKLDSVFSNQFIWLSYLITESDTVALTSVTCIWIHLSAALQLWSSFECFLYVLLIQHRSKALG